MKTCIAMEMVSCPRTRATYRLHLVSDFCMDWDSLSLWSAVEWMWKRDEWLCKGLLPSTTNSKLSFLCCEKFQCLMKYSDLIRQSRWGNVLLWNLDDSHPGEAMYVVLPPWSDHSLSKWVILLLIRQWNESFFWCQQLKLAWEKCSGGDKKKLVMNV